MNRWIHGHNGDTTSWHFNCVMGRLEVRIYRIDDGWPVLLQLLRNSPVPVTIDGHMTEDPRIYELPPTCILNLGYENAGLHFAPQSNIGGLIVSGGNRRVETIGMMCNYRSMTVLRMNDVNLEFLPDELWRVPLVTLDVSHNKIAEIPDSYARFRTLKQVYLRRNNLTKLPWQFRNCQLEVIELMHNDELSLREQWMKADVYLLEVRAYDFRARKQQMHE